MESPLLTVKETAAYLRVSSDIAYTLVRSEDFPSIKVAGSWRVIKKELDEWIEKQKEEKPECIPVFR